MFLNKYEWEPQPVLRLVTGSSLIASIGITSILSFVAQRYAFPKKLEGMVAGTLSGTRITETFSELCRKMSIRGVSLRQATVGNAFSLENRGWKVVAMSRELVASMSPLEVEAVIAHELSHLKNKDAREKGLARVAKLAFAFDPVLHLAEAAIHRERELLADQSSVRYTEKPLALASALLKVHSAFRTNLPEPGAGLFVGRRARGLLSRYPDLDHRVQRLIDLAREMKRQTVLA